MLARCLRGTLGQQHRAALFLRADSTLYQSVGSRRFAFSFFDLLQPITAHAERLRALRPTMLAAPPAALVQLARLPGAAGLLAEPRILLSVADVLDAADRAPIEAGFECPVGQLYQATEGFLAASCAHGNLHWNEDAVVVQKAWLDAAKTHYSPIITDFRRMTQPIIRYQLDDVIRESRITHCPCGSRFGLLGGIEGRRDDVLYLPSTNGNAVVQIFPDFVRRAIILAVATGVDYRVRQMALQQWDVALSDPAAAADVTREVAQLCARLAARAPQLNFIAWQPETLLVKSRIVQFLVQPGSF
jgi:putative adenylate-forming enzyme